jgi:RNA polymerase sigma-54 factor
MKQSLQLRLGQQLTMTPQLQQAIRLLQLSTMDLQLEIQQALDTNIMLEMADEFSDGDDDEPNDSAANESSEDNLDISTHTDEREVNLDDNSNLPDELPLDSNWEATYDNSSYDHPSTAQGDREDYDPFARSSPAQSLYDHLLWQLELTPFGPLDREIALAIIDAVDNDGYLKATLEDLCASVDDKVELDEVEAVLHRIQHFDPAGVAARNLGECLAIQLRQLPAVTPWRAEALILVQDFLDILGSRDYTQIIRKMKLSRDELQEVIALIQSLQPRPGSLIGDEQAAYVVPDVFVKKYKGEWRVELNGEIAPRLRINSVYAGLIHKAGSRTEMDSLKNHLQEARWFIKSLQSRHETLLKVTQCIMERQTGFLNYGEEAMKPLVLHDIAEELGMHESTISRVTTQKFVHTPRGIFELKYFFSSHVSTDSGGECSSTAIRALIKKLIAAENCAKPLSDSKIATLLSQQGIQVARRTVAKYRESMMIPPSNERKCLA